MNLHEGIVEKDDVSFGIVQVRIFGKHTHDRTELPTDDLQYAQILYPAESNIDEQSYFRTIRNGTRVVISFLDESEQHPIILGSLVKKINEQPDSSIGFSDPDGVYPDAAFVGESTISRLARNESISETISQTKTDEAQTGISCVDITFDQPANPYGAVYPENRVLQTKGHVIEIDDSDGAERINIYHKSGTFTEIHPDGTETKKIKVDKFLSVAGDNNITVAGNVNLQSDGNVNVDATQINLNGSTTSAVGYTELLTAFDTLKGELNALVTAYNTATYTIGGLGTTGTTSVVGVEAAADMSGAEKPTVKLP